jgi:hypothetical protein
MKLTKLKYNPDNPRRISPEQLDRLIKSIESLPKMMELRPIVYDPATMYVLGGNQRLAALRKMGKTEIPDTWVKSADEMTEKEKREFILRDNVQSGEWDYGVLEENFADFDLDDIGIELPEVISPDGFGADFSLPEGDKPPFQQMTFTLADAQAEHIKAAIDTLKDQAPEIETFGNENSNGNALYEIVRQWAEQKK